MPKRIPGPYTRFTVPPPLPCDDRVRSDLDQGLQALVEQNLAELPALLQAFNAAVQSRQEQQASAAYKIVEGATTNVLRVIASGTKAGASLFYLQRATELIRNSLYTVTNTMSRGSKASIADLALQNADMVTAVGALCHELEAIAADPALMKDGSHNLFAPEVETHKDRVEKALKKLTFAYAAELPAALSALRVAIEAGDQATCCARFRRAKNRALNVIRAMETAKKGGVGQFYLLQAVKAVRDGLYTITNSMSRSNGEEISAVALAHKALAEAACKTLTSLEATLNDELETFA